MTKAQRDDLAWELSHVASGASIMVMGLLTPGTNPDFDGELRRLRSSMRKVEKLVADSRKAAA